MVCLAGVDLALILKMVRHFWALVSRACLRLSVQLKFRIKNFDIALCACCGNNTLYWLLFFWFYCCIYGVYSVICFNCLWKVMQYATSSHAPTISASISPFLGTTKLGYGINYSDCVFAKINFIVMAVDGMKILPPRKCCNVYSFQLHSHPLLCTAVSVCF